MTKEQIEYYETCKKDLIQKKMYKVQLPFHSTLHGEGKSKTYDLLVELEAIHKEMYDEVRDSIDKAIEKIENKINVL